MSSISTHVLDTSLGMPASGIDVTLERSGEIVGRGVTNGDGRVSDLSGGNGSFESGEYTLRFAVGSYFSRSGRKAFYPDITISFVVDDAAQHYHVPLLLSPFGYSTYRGS